MYIVPLSPRCLEMLEQVRAVNRSTPLTGLIFPASPGGPLSNMAFIEVLRRLGLGHTATAHGFRTSFKDWATEVAKVREVVSEAALLHTVKDKTEAAYRRAIYLEERITLMARWASFCTGITPLDVVVRCIQHY